MKFKNFKASAWGIWLVIMLAIPWVLGIVYLLYELSITLSTPMEDLFGNIRAILLTLAALIGVPFLILRTWLADKQTQINQESHYTDLFTKAVELLGVTYHSGDGKPRPAIESRVGAIFALERLAKQSQSDYGSIIETLSAYIREQCGNPSVFIYEGQDPDEEGLCAREKWNRLRAWYDAHWVWVSGLTKDPPANRADVAAALTVLSRRSKKRLWKTRKEGETHPNLSGVNLQGADLSLVIKGLYQRDTKISNAHLEGIHLPSAFDCQQGPLTSPSMRQDPIGYVLAPKNLTGIRATNFSIKSVEILPVFDGATLPFADMEGAKLQGIRFRGSTLVNANFENAKVSYGKFGIANLTHANFKGSDLNHTEFIGALLHDANFAGANLSNAVFEGAFLRGSKFDGALLVGTDFMGANEVQAEMIQKAYGTADTSLPSGLIRPGQWKDEDSAVKQWEAFRDEHRIIDRQNSESR